jgi:hypothetical protein
MLLQVAKDLWINPAHVSGIQLIDGGTGEHDIRLVITINNGDLEPITVNGGRRAYHVMDQLGIVNSNPALHMWEN